MSNIEHLASNNLMLALAHEMEIETDRGTALLSGAYLDELLRNLITAILFDHSKPFLKILFEGPAAPLATFAGKQTMAYGLGLITSEQNRQITELRSVRNDFAHQLLGLDFRNSNIVKKCRKLEVSGIVAGTFDARDTFILVSCRVMVSILLKTRELTAKQGTTSN